MQNRASLPAGPGLGCVCVTLRRRKCGPDVAESVISLPDYRKLESLTACKRFRTAGKRSFFPVCGSGRAGWTDCAKWRSLLVARCSLLVARCSLLVARRSSTTTSAVISFGSAAQVRLVGPPMRRLSRRHWCRAQLELGEGIIDTHDLSAGSAHRPVRSAVGDTHGDANKFFDLTNIVRSFYYLINAAGNGSPGQETATSVTSKGATHGSVGC